MLRPQVNNVGGSDRVPTGCVTRCNPLQLDARSVVVVCNAARVTHQTLSSSGTHHLARKLDLKTACSRVSVWFRLGSHQTSNTLHVCAKHCVPRRGRRLGAMRDACSVKQVFRLPAIKGPHSSTEQCRCGFCDEGYKSSRLINIVGEAGALCADERVPCSMVSTRVRVQVSTQSLQGLTLDGGRSSEGGCDVRGNLVDGMKGLDCACEMDVD